jgi:hypothetical protein
MFKIACLVLKDKKRGAILSSVSSSRNNSKTCVCWVKTVCQHHGQHGHTFIYLNSYSSQGHQDRATGIPKAGALLLEPQPKVYFAQFILEIGFFELFA